MFEYLDISSVLSLKYLHRTEGRCCGGLSLGIFTELTGNVVGSLSLHSDRLERLLMRRGQGGMAPN